MENVRVRKTDAFVIISTINRIRRKFTRINLFDNEETLLQQGITITISTSRMERRWIKEFLYTYFPFRGSLTLDRVSFHGEAHVRGIRFAIAIDSSIIRASEQSPGIGRDSRLFRLCMDRVLVTRVTRCIRAMPRMAREY